MPIFFSAKYMFSMLEANRAVHDKKKTFIRLSGAYIAQFTPHLLHIS